MAEPVIIDCPADTWVLVAEDVTTGQIWKMLNVNRGYLQTYRTADNPAPTNDDDAVPAFPNNTINLPISATALIDVYIKAVGSAGKVRVDIP